jgi:hypothetical protein
LIFDAAENLGSLINEVESYLAAIGYRRPSKA